MAVFPEDFLWGAATSAHQIEGSPLADGAGPSIWYRFARTPGRVRDPEAGDVACDHYRRFADDVKVMRELGLGAYRFSIAWGRVFPRGFGPINRKGLDFYSRLVDLLLENGIQPAATLYHWDLPAALDDLGGWLNPEIARWFADYARACFEALDDRVRLWFTLNEPWVVTDAGYLHGTHAPGHRSLFEPPMASHNLLRAHAAAVRAYREKGKNRIGIVVNLEPKHPASESAEDLAATRRADAYMNRQYLDPVFLGRYPEEMAEIYGEAWPRFPESELAEIRQPIDFLGVNYYTRGRTRHDANEWPVYAARLPSDRLFHTVANWEVFPPAFTECLCWVRDRYGPIPLYVTENGAAFYDPPQAIESEIDDPLRVHYLREHLRALDEAMRRGVDVRGYFVWSLLDNVEWAGGVGPRFGIVHVDYETQRRTIKKSGRFYRDVIRSRGAVLDEKAAEERTPAKASRR